MVSYGDVGAIAMKDWSAGDVESYCSERWVSYVSLFYETSCLGGNSNDIPYGCLIKKILIFFIDNIRKSFN